jgi:hypothetical protein
MYYSLMMGKIFYITAPFPTATMRGYTPWHRV